MQNSINNYGPTVIFVTERMVVNYSCKVILSQAGEQHHLFRNDACPLTGLLSAL